MGVEDPYRDCDLCPRRCGVDRLHGQVGYCGSSDRPVVARAALHMWEEPPISGSKGSGTIFFSGCSLGCVYCQNHAISRSNVGDEVDEVRLSDIMLDLQDQDALNINLVTPTHFAPTIRRSIIRAKERGLDIPIVWNTGGYERASCIYDNAGLVDIYLSDMKYFSDGIAKGYSGIDDYFDHAIEAIDAMLETVGTPVFDEVGSDRRMVRGVIVRHMVLPGRLDDSKRVLEELHARFGGSILYSIMNQYTPVLSRLADEGDPHACRVLSRFPELGRAVSVDEYEQVLDHADGIGIEDYFWQDGPTCEESFIPDFASETPSRGADN